MSLYRSNLGIKYQLRLDPRLWLWSLKILTQCTAAAARRNTEVKFRLLRYALDQLNQVVAETGIAYEELSHGILYYFRSASGLAAAADHAAILRDLGLPLELLDRDAVMALEPVLARAPEIAGALYSPTCQSGNCNLFATSLADWAMAHLGITIELSATIRRIVAERGKVVRVETDKGEITADAYVLAAGAESVLLGESAGLRLPIYPVKGFSATLPILDPARIPGRSVVDEDKLIAITPMGDRLRVAASAVFGGFDAGHRPSDFASIEALVADLFGDAVDSASARYWSGFRPMTPTSGPILGRSPLANLFLNVGHGHVGWSMCCGAAALVADVIADRRPAISEQGLTLA
jgi:D-amino-acid dehydrogenase